MVLFAVENLRFFAELHQLPDAEPRIRALLERLGLWARRSEPAGSYSKGMRQRLAIARAILHDPEVVFLDEPTSALDPVAAKGVREIVAELKGRGRTIVLCTHNLDEAERLCDRIAVLRTRVLRMDTPRGLRRSLGGTVLRVRLAVARESDVALARAVEGVLDAELDAEGLRARVDDSDLRAPALVRALVAAGADVRSVGEETRTLEHAYLDLVGETLAEASPA